MQQIEVTSTTQGGVLRKTLSVLMAIVLALGMMPLPKQAYAADLALASITPADIGSGADFEIKDQASYNAFRNAVNSGATDANTKATVTADFSLTLGSSSLPAGTVDVNEGGQNTYDPTAANPFLGTFDGQGHTITLTISSMSSLGSKTIPPAALIGVVGSTGVVKNVIVKGKVCPSDLSNSTSSNINGVAAGAVGVLLGGTVENVANYATIGSGNNSSDTCNAAGGIVGYGYGTIKNCANHGAVSKMNGWTGGILGRGSASKTVTIENCYNTGKVLLDGFALSSYGYAHAGIASSYNGPSYASTMVITNCYNVGEVAFDGSGTAPNYGLVDKTTSSIMDSSITNSYYLQGQSAPASGITNAAEAKSQADMEAAAFVTTMGSAYATSTLEGQNTPALAWEVAGSEAPATYGVTVTEPQNGTVSTDKTANIAQGETVTLTITPAANYEVDTIAVKDSSNNDVTVTDNAFTMPASDVTVTVTFKETPVSYNVTVASGIVGGTVTASPTTATKGATITLTATPASSEYKLAKYTVTDANGAEVTVTGNTFTMPASNVTVSATFEKKHLILTVVDNNGEYGMPGREFTKELTSTGVGHDIWVKISEAFKSDVAHTSTDWGIREADIAGLKLDWYQVGGNADGTDKLLGTTYPEWNSTMEAYGWYSPKQNYSFNLKWSEAGVYEYYCKATWELDGYDTVSSQTENWKFTVVAPTYDVTFDADGGTPAPEAQKVDEGAKASEPAAPTKDGYEFVGWFNGDTQYDFSAAVTANVSLKAKWNKISSIDKADAQNGSFTVTDGTTEVTKAAEGATVVVEPTAASGYEVDTVSYTAKQSGSSLAANEVLVEATPVTTLEAGQTYLYVAEKDGSTWAMMAETGSPNSLKGTSVTMGASNGNKVVTFASESAVAKHEWALTGANGAWKLGNDGKFVECMYYGTQTELGTTGLGMTYDASTGFSSNDTDYGWGPLSYNTADGVYRFSKFDSSKMVHAAAYKVLEAPSAAGSSDPVTVSKTNGEYSFAMPGYDITVSVTFKEQTTPKYKVTKAAATNGSFNVSDNEVEAGTQITVTPTPADGYELDAITVKDADGGDVAVTNGAFTMPEKDVTVSVSFKLKKYTITWSVDGATTKSEVEHGTVPAYGGTPTKASTEQYDYTFAGWDPEPAAATADATYTAKFDQATRKYTVEFKNGDEVLQSSEVEYGTMPEYTGQEPVKAADADNTYAFKGWTPALEAVKGAATYQAEFTATPIDRPQPQTYAVRYGVPEHGALTVTPDENVAAGTEVVVSASPEEGYELDMITYTPEGGEAVDITSDGKFDMPAKNVTVTVTFKAKATPDPTPTPTPKPTPTPDPAASEYNVIVAKASNGTVTASVAKAKAGAKIAVKATPAAGYELAKLTYKPAGGDAVDITKASSFTMPAGDVTVAAVFGKAAPGSDPSQKAADGTSLGKGASAAAAAKAITSSKSEEGPAGSKYGELRLRSTKQAKASVTLKWSKVKGTASYVVYGAKCGKKMQEVKSLRSASLKVTKASGAKLKAGAYYKFMVVALDKAGSVVSSSKVIHVATKGGKVGNYKAVTIGAKKAKAGKVTLKKGKKLSLKAKAVSASKKLKVSKHRGLKYETSNAKVATVSKKGVVKAKGKGTCYVYAYTQNGVFKRVKVTVK